MNRRVRLHSGGISPDLVRLSPRGSSERKTAPGKDIRDIRGDHDRDRRCQTCNSKCPSGSRCQPCRDDQRIISAARKILRAEGLPGLHVAMAKGVPHMKTRRRAIAAQERIAKRARKSGLITHTVGKKGTEKRNHAGHAKQVKKSSPTAGQPRKVSRRVCRTCFIILPATGSCEYCAG